MPPIYTFTSQDELLLTVISPRGIGVGSAVGSGVSVGSSVGTGVSVGSGVGVGVGSGGLFIVYV